jgi:phosphatidylinositol-bisphosphatase
MKVNVTVYVQDPWVASSLNFGVDELEDLIILHTERGKDHFISLSGKWLPSCFGNDLRLLGSTKPMHQYAVKELVAALLESRKGGASPKQGTVPGFIESAGRDATAASDKKTSIPLSVWRLTDFIFKFGKDVVSFFIFSCGDDRFSKNQLSFFAGKHFQDTW